VWHIWRRGEMHTEFLWGNLKESLGRPRLRRKYNIKLDLKKQDEKRCTAVICLMTGTVDEVLLAWY
jgi:hypothetical protein